MGWPLSQDYNEAIQDPAQSFADPDLRTLDLVGSGGPTLEALPGGRNGLLLKRPSAAQSVDPVLPFAQIDIGLTNLRCQLHLSVDRVCLGRPELGV